MTPLAHTEVSLFGPERYGGSAFRHHYTEQGINKSRQFIGQVRMKSQTGELKTISLETLQLIAGIGRPILEATTLLT